MLSFMMPRDKGMQLNLCKLLWHGADDARDFPVVRCIIAPDNGASIRAAEKCGFVPIWTGQDTNGRVNLCERITLQSP
jgi:RimJ/RimL family protein N-acetyltransferase